MQVCIPRAVFRARHPGRGERDSCRVGMASQPRCGRRHLRSNLLCQESGPMHWQSSSCGPSSSATNHLAPSGPGYCPGSCCSCCTSTVSSRYQTCCGPSHLAHAIQRTGNDDGTRCHHTTCVRGLNNVLASLERSSLYGTFKDSIQTCHSRISTFRTVQLV